MVFAIRDVRPLLKWPLLLVLVCLAIPLWGQDATTFKTKDPGKGFVEVGGNWHFHTGDDLARAQPGIDDSSWEQLSSTDPVTVGGFESAPRVGDSTYLELQKKPRGMALQRRRQARMEMEVRSACEVQQIPETVPPVPGFAIDSVYKPAAELGGDFFQVMTLPDTSTGSLRTLADYTQQPAEILQGLNRRLFGRVQDGFATCMVLRLETNGEATIANAGHLAPFRDGEELPLRGSLPLGILADAVYEDLVFRLQEAETLTLYTDGIVEARNATRELFGFERVQRLAQDRKSAEQIVEAACAFGQENDITVLSIRRLAAAEERVKARVNLTAQIATV